MTSKAKKPAAIFLMLSIAFGLAGCGKKGELEPPKGYKDKSVVAIVDAY